MKIKLFSDLHLEFRNYLFDHIYEGNPGDDETTLLLAGDISTGTTAIPFVEDMCKRFKHVLMIHGNHEYYHNDFGKTVKAWQDWDTEGSPENFNFLYNDWRILDGVRFLGGTMWTGFAGVNPITMGLAASSMNDYRSIVDGGVYITPDFILKEHEKFMEFLREKFSETFDGPTVVMTHHSPGGPLRGRGAWSRYADFYFADLEKMIGEEDKAVLWVHGHTHASQDYKINNTRVVCNPYGYWGHDVNREFERGLILEV